MYIITFIMFLDLLGKKWRKIVYISFMLATYLWLIYIE